MNDKDILSILQNNRKTNLHKNYEVPHIILEQAEAFYESGRHSYSYITGENYYEQKLWWDRSCSFVYFASYTWVKRNYYKIQLTFIKDEIDG